MHRELIEQLARVLNPACIVLPLSNIEGEGFEVQEPKGSLGWIWPSENAWGVTRLMRPVSATCMEAQAIDSVTNGYLSLPAAVRHLFGMKDDATVVIETDIDDDSQEHSFMNSTLQDASDTVAFSVATEVDVPFEIAERGQQVIAEYLGDVLATASRRVPSIKFHVQLGPKIRE